MQNAISIADNIINITSKIGIEKGKSNFFIFDDNNVIERVDKIQGLSVSGGKGG